MNYAANDNTPPRASNGVSLARVSGMPNRPVPEPVVPWDAPEPQHTERLPLAEAIAQGLFSREQQLALDYWLRTHKAAEVSFGMGSMVVGGVSQPFVSRPADALWGQELAAERGMVLCKLYRRLGQLVDVIDAAIDGAEMRDLAPPRLLFPIDKRALAGRIRLGAGLDIVSVFSSEAGCSARNALEIISAASDACHALVAKRRLRASNDNVIRIDVAA